MLLIAHWGRVLLQEKTAELQKTRVKGKIATEIVPEAHWYTAEEYHQVSHRILSQFYSLAEYLLLLYERDMFSHSLYGRCMDFISEPNVNLLCTQNVLSNIGLRRLAVLHACPNALSNILQKYLDNTPGGYCNHRER